MLVNKVRVQKRAASATISATLTLADKVNKMDQDRLKSELLKHPEYILLLKNSTEELRKIALTENPDLISELPVPSDLDYLTAIREDGLLIRHILVPSNKLVMEALSQNGLAIQYIPDPNKDQQKRAVLSDPFSLQFLKKPHADAITAALKENGLCIQFIKKPTEIQQLLAVRSHPSAISLIENPTKRVLEAAIEANGLSIEFCDKPSEELQLLAIRSSEKGLAIRYISEPTPKVQEEAYFKNKENLNFIPDPPEKVQLDAVTVNPDNVALFVPTKAVQELLLTFLKSRPRIFDLVDKVDPTVLKEVLKKSEFYEKIERKVDVPENMTLEQLRLLRFLERKNITSIPAYELKRQDWSKESKLIKTLLKKSAKEKGIISREMVIKTKDTVIPDQEGLGELILNSKMYLGKFDDPCIFGKEQKAFILGISGKELQDLDKPLRIALKKQIKEQSEPYISHLLNVAYVQYTLLGQDVWIHTVRCPALNVLESRSGLYWVQRWVLAKFIREMRHRSYQKFYAPNSNLRQVLYGDDEKAAAPFDVWPSKALFNTKIIKAKHPLVNGKEAFCLD